MTRDPAILAARSRVLAAKVRLDQSVSRARARLSPRALVNDAVETATDKATVAAHAGLQAARERPAIAAAVLGACGLALAHRPLFALFRRRHATAPKDVS